MFLEEEKRFVFWFGLVLFCFPKEINVSALLLLFVETHLHEVKPLNLCEHIVS